jgi:hypothetical protein
MTGDDVDPEDPRPGRHPRFRDNEWHYAPEELCEYELTSAGP